MLRLGEKIKELRRKKNLSQETLAHYLGVSFQAVSKWENGSTMPDVTMIPAIASFFQISTDELFNFNLYEIEQNVDAIVEEFRKYRVIDKSKAEQLIREGLKRYPGNEVLLNCLIDILSVPEQSDEVISVAKALVECAKYDEVKYDAYRIMAEAYHARGELQLAKEAIEHIPEIYFSKLEIAAKLLADDDKYEAAQKQKGLSANTLINMLIIIGKYLQEQGEYEKAHSQFRIAEKVIEAFSDDYLESRFFYGTIYDATFEQRKEIEQLLYES